MASGQHDKQTRNETMTKTRKDSLGRVWNYCDGEGSWQHGKHVIGCGGKNGSKWAIWGGPCAGHCEFNTLREAMGVCQ